MSFVVSNSSVPEKLKASLLGAILPAVAVLHALGVDWGATSEVEQVARDSAVVLTATAVVVATFALYAHFKRTTVGEPVAVAGAIAGVLAASLALFLAFDWFEEGVVLAVYALLGALLLPFGITLTRQQVWPASRVQSDPTVEPQDHFRQGGYADPVVLIGVAALVAIAIGVLIIAID